MSDFDGNNKRSISLTSLRTRQSLSYDFLAIGDSPWYCYWNQTIEEFWIFLEQDNDTSSSTVSAQPQNQITSAPTNPYGFPTAAPSTPSEAASATTSMPNEVEAAGSEPTWPPKRKRHYSSDFAFPATSLAPGMPNLVKMVEKRKPHSNIQPYCQQMTVLPNWQIVPKEGVDTICIEEIQYAEETGSIEKRWVDKRNKVVRGEGGIIKRLDFTEQLESLCICEWVSSDT
jgi:hypothetical protein